MNPEHTCDVIVAGATLGGCLTAAAAARRGAQVVLVEASPFLGTDLTAVLRPWIAGIPGPDPAVPRLQELLLPPAEAVEVDVDLRDLPSGWPPETCLFRGSVRKRLFEELDAAGVTTLLMATPAAVLGGGGSVTGLLVACKQGLLLLRAAALVDCTAGADVLRLWQPALVPTPIRQRCHFTLGFAGAAWPPAPVLEVGPSAIGASDPRFGLADDRVRFHAGRSSACGLFAEFAMDLAAGLPVHLSGAALDRAAQEPVQRRWRAWVESWVRYKAFGLTMHLVRHVPAFAKATLVETAAAVRLPPPPRPAAGELPRGLYRGPDPLPVEPSWDDLAALARSADEEAGVALRCGPPAPPDTELRSAVARVPLSGCELGPLEDPGLGLAVAQVRLRSLGDVPAVDTCDVLVAGGGTAGANAVVAAREAGADTVILEQLHDLGGTQTLGLVSGYYHGYRGGFTARLDECVTARGCVLHNGRLGNRRVAKMLNYLLDAVHAPGHTRWYPNAVVCGAEVEAGQVRGLLAADREGLFRVRAKVALDATGDGDAAVFCGASSTFGDPRSGSAQDYSQWSLGRGGWESLSADLDVIDQRLLSEVQRGLRLAHRRGRWFDFAAMLTVREGRHIEGEHTLDLRDILSGRPFDDTLAVACTDWDPHGIGTSWLSRLGFLPVHTEPIPVRIPLRCCIPRGLRGLLVTAKAISATPDAACLCRMAPDVQNLGYATGLAAAAAAAGDGDPRHLDLPALTARLRELGIVTDQLPVPWPAASDPASAVARLAAGDEMALREVALLDRTVALPLLEAALQGPGGDRLNLAKGLAWFGALADGGPLAAELRRLAALEVTPYEDAHPRKAGNPRAGIVDQPDDYWRINQLLVLIGLAGAAEAVPAVADLIQRTTAGGPPLRALNAYIRARIDMQRVPHFDRLLSIAFCAERLGHPGLAQPLEGLLQQEFVGGWMRPAVDEAGSCYYSALAEVLLAAAAARCGSRPGVLRLASFLDDVHGILVRFARNELREITGQDAGWERAAWEARLLSAPPLKPTPLPRGEPVF